MFHFMLCLGSMFDLLAGDLIRNLSRLHLQGTKALPLRLSRSRCGPGGAKASAPKISASCSVLGKKFELFTDTLTADGRASRFKAERFAYAPEGSRLDRSFTENVPGSVTLSQK